MKKPYMLQLQELLHEMGGTHTLEDIQAHHHAVGAGGVGERVTRGGGANPLAALGGAAHDLLKLLDGARPLDRRGHALLITRPVAPHEPKPTKGLSPGEPAR